MLEFGNGIALIVVFNGASDRVCLLRDTSCRVASALAD
jgi:hypothetical protein